MLPSLYGKCILLNLLKLYFSILRSFRFASVSPSPSHVCGHLLTCFSLGGLSSRTAVQLSLEFPFCHRLRDFLGLSLGSGPVFPLCRISIFGLFSCFWQSVSCYHFIRLCAWGGRLCDRSPRPKMSLFYLHSRLIVGIIF